jgi:hypothetical protein
LEVIAMGFNFHLPLPGPFSYTARLGGNQPKRSHPVTRNDLLICLGLLAAAWPVVMVVRGVYQAFGYWGIGVLTVGAALIAVPLIMRFEQRRLRKSAEAEQEAAKALADRDAALASFMRERRYRR